MSPPSRRFIVVARSFVPANSGRRGICLFGVNAVGAPRRAVSFAAPLAYLLHSQTGRRGFGDQQLAISKSMAGGYGWRLGIRKGAAAAAEESRLLGNWQINSRRGLAEGEGLFLRRQRDQQSALGGRLCGRLLISFAGKPAGEGLAVSNLGLASSWLGVMAGGLGIRKGANSGRGITAFKRLANQQPAMRGLAACVVWLAGGL